MNTNRTSNTPRARQLLAAARLAGRIVVWLARAICIAGMWCVMFALHLAASNDGSRRRRPSNYELYRDSEHLRDPFPPYVGKGAGIVDADGDPW